MLVVGLVFIAVAATVGYFSVPAKQSAAPTDGKAAILARIQKVGIAPDDLRNVHLR